MRRKRARNTSYIAAILLLLIVGISVGYAAITTTLNINGTSNIGKSTWDVHFENLVVSTGSVTATTPAKIQTDNTSITYTVTLNNPGDYYEFTVDVKNGGTMPAKISATPSLTGVSTAQDVYINYSVKYSSGTTIAANDTLAVGETKTFKVRVEFDSTIDADDLPSTTSSLNLGFSVNYVQQ